MTQFSYARYSGIIFALLLLSWWAFFSGASQHPRDTYTQAHYHTDTAQIYLYLGKSALKRKNYRQAISAYTAALSHDPNLVQAKQGLLLAQKANI